MSMRKNPESIMEEAIDKHWSALEAANERLRTSFMNIVRSACPSLRFRAESNEDGLRAGHEYGIALEGCYVVTGWNEGARVVVELLNTEGQNQSSRYVPPRTAVDHLALFDHLGLLED